MTKTTGEKDMADEDDQETPGGGGKDKGKKGDKPEPIPYASKRGQAGPGYFTLYKRGQGYWTRMGTVIGAVLIGAFTAYELYAQLPTFLPDRLGHNRALQVSIAITAVFAIAYSLFCWHYMNKPGNADFLIATDSEMKKVNWTSRTELIGSTKIVIIFMFLVAIFLFAVDTEFGQAFYYLRVINVPPISWDKDADALKPSDIPAVDVTTPSTQDNASPTVLAPAHQPIGGAIPLVIAGNVVRVSVVPSILSWILWHLAGIAVFGSLIAYIFRKKHPRH
ncbi:MAG TPA: preprotein translocase subunit SecE [Tepidisphaeraceae bacterium]|nr:preprotein translocase subunit SecE [Tepidisphaeraceae bacterium]